MPTEIESDPIQTHVDNCVEKLCDIFTEQRKPGFCAVHFLCGPANAPGMIRKSSLNIKEGTDLFLFASQWQQQTPGADVKEKHKDVLLKYIRHLDRENTFLNVIKDSFKKAIDDDKNLEEIVIHFTHSSNSSKPYECNLPLDFTQFKSIGDSKKEGEWIYGPMVPNMLSPDITRKYFEYLYGLDRANDNEWAKLFEIGRAEVYGKKHLSFNDESYCKLEDLPLNIPSKETIPHWKAMSALQSAMLYFSYTSAKKKSISGTAVCVHNKRQALSDAFPFGLAIFSKKLTATEIAKVSHKLKISLNAICEEIAQSAEYGENIYPDFKEQIEDRTVFRDALKNLYVIPVQQYRIRAVGLWMLSIMEQLQDTIHEGGALEFFFSAGDESTFQDHHNIHFKQLDPDEVELFAVPNPDEVKRLAVPPKTKSDIIIEKAKQAAKVLGKEHFPWFERGRNALFWDITSDSFKPSGLIEIRGSSWEYAVAERFRDKQRLDIPMCLTIFSIGASKEAGAIILHGINSKDKEEKPAKVIELVRWRNKKWSKLGNDRKKKLLDKLTERLNYDGSDIGHLEEVVNIALMVADNPRTGGALLLSKNVAILDSFSKMGIPWHLKKSSMEDRISLISHDGATARQIAGGELGWRHRLLLLPDGDWSKIRKVLVEHSKELEKNFPLTGAGSRRWSAALSAFHDIVDCVIVISQDGDIQCWIIPNKSLSLDGSLILTLPQSGTSKLYDPEKGQMEYA